jgi:PAS domain S-box-containing protein
LANDPRDFVNDNARELLDDFIDLVQVISPEGTFLYVNRAFSQHLGWSADDAAGMTFLDVIHPDHRAAWKNIFRAVLGGKRLDNFEMVLLAKSGAPVAVDGSVWSRRDPDGTTVVCAVFRDSAARAIGEQQVSRVMYRDEATGVLNRHGFIVRGATLLEVVEENRDRLGAFVLHIAIANLIDIQRRHGDAAHDEAVALTVEITRRALRAHDIVARLSREHFVALVSLPPKYPPSYVTARIRGALTLANRQAGREWNVELALGLATVDLARPLDDAIERAAADAITPKIAARA